MTTRQLLDGGAGLRPSWPRWTLGCGLAEVVGMVAAASAFALSLAWLGEPRSLGVAALTVAIAMTGGAMEGAAVGAVQWLLLRRWLTRLGATSWIGVTVAAAMLGWLLGMIPSVAASLAAGEAEPNGSAAGPPFWVMPLLGIASGLLLGALFGAAQSLVLRHHVENSRLWIWANAYGWAAGLTVMFIGAGIPSGPWPWTQLVPLAAATGVLAGLAVGAVTGAFLPRLRLLTSRPGA